MSAIIGVTMYPDVSKYRWFVPKHIKELQDRTLVPLLAVQSAPPSGTACNSHRMACHNDSFSFGLLVLLYESWQLRAEDYIAIFEIESLSYAPYLKCTKCQNGRLNNQQN